jgi:hypothetical protein
MSDREKLLADFVDAALALMKEGLSGLTVEKAILVERAQAAGADVCLVFSPGAQKIVLALHPADPDADVVELLRIVVPFPEVSH